MLYTVTLHLRWRPSKLGTWSFNLLTRRFVMNHAQVHGKLLPWRITWKRSTISYWQTGNWICAKYLRQWVYKRPPVSYPAWNIGHEEAVGALSVTSAHSGQHKQMWNYFTAVSIPFRDRRRNMEGTHQRPNNSGIRGFHSTNYEDCAIGRKCDICLYLGIFTFIWIFKINLPAVSVVELWKHVCCLHEVVT